MSLNINFNSYRRMKLLQKILYKRTAKFYDRTQNDDCWKFKDRAYSSILCLRAE